MRCFLMNKNLFKLTFARMSTRFVPTNMIAIIVNLLLPCNGCPRDEFYIWYIVRSRHDKEHILYGSCFQKFDCPPIFVAIYKIGLRRETILVSAVSVAHIFCQRTMFPVVVGCVFCIVFCVIELCFCIQVIDKERIIDRLTDAYESAKHKD